MNSAAPRYRRLGHHAGGVGAAGAAWFEALFRPLGLLGTLQVALLVAVLVVLVYLSFVSRSIARPLLDDSGGGGGSRRGKRSADDDDGYGLPAFSAPGVHFDEYPRRVAIENEFDCNARSLRKCRLDDPRTLFGCRELLVRCHHFARDTVHAEHNTTVIIPRNADPNEGYALAIPVAVEACNPYHGNLALVTLSVSSRQYLLLCDCKNPGYVGKATLLGDCSAPAICGGRVVTLDAPLDKLECRCRPHEHSVRYEDGLPACKTLLVHEANARHSDWTALIPWDNDRTLPTGLFSVSITNNVNTRVLLDPCRNALTDPRIEIPNGRYDAEHGQCFLTGYGFPLVLDLLRTRNKVPPAAGEIAPSFVSAVLPTSAYRRLRISGGISGRGRFFAIVTRGIQFGPLGRPELESGVVTLVPEGSISVGGPHSRGAVSINPRGRSFWASRCHERNFGYNCVVRENYGSTSAAGLPIAAVHDPPTLFLWGTEDWTVTESRANASLKEGVYGIHVVAEELSRDRNLQGYGLQWCAYHDPEASGVVMFEQSGDYQLHRQAISGPEAPAEPKPVRAVTPTERRAPVVLPASQT